jgi:hypothetical protein
MAYDRKGDQTGESGDAGDSTGDFFSAAVFEDPERQKKKEREVEKEEEICGGNDEKWPGNAGSCSLPHRFQYRPPIAQAKQV